MNFTPSTIAALVIAASFAAGLNVYATVLTLGVLARLHWAVLPGGLEMLLRLSRIRTSRALVVGGAHLPERIRLGGTPGHGNRRPQYDGAPDPTLHGDHSFCSFLATRHVVVRRTRKISTGRITKT